MAAMNGLLVTGRGVCVKNNDTHTFIMFSDTFQKEICEGYDHRNNSQSGGFFAGLIRLCYTGLRFTESR